VIAVTVLAGLDDSDLRAVGVEFSPLEQAVRTGEIGANCGEQQGCVCSPQEIPAIRAACGKDFTLSCARNPSCRK